MSNKDTKEKILSVAATLFAANGYDSTSIRDISKEAGVNLASINYHFKNKLNLYKEVLNMSMLALEDKIESIQATDLKSFYWELFSIFTADNEAFVNGFKLFVGNNVQLTEDYMPEACAKDFGPPGFRKMMSIVNAEVGDDLPLLGREWLVRTIFSYVAHSALFMGSSFCKLMEDKAPFLKPEEKRRSIENLVEASLNFLREHPEKFE
jgi:AcrR family transcriptional regulator